MGLDSLSGASRRATSLITGGCLLWSLVPGGLEVEFESVDTISFFNFRKCWNQYKVTCSMVTLMRLL